MAYYLDLLQHLPSLSKGDHRQPLQEWYAQTVKIDTQPLRILIVLSQQPGETGSGVFLRETVHELQKLGHTPYLLAAHYRPLSSADFQGLPDDHIDTLIFSDQHNSPNAEVNFPIPGMSPDMPYLHISFHKLTDEQLEEYCAAWVHKIREVVDKVQPHILHVNHLWFLPAVACLATPWLPIVATAHGTESMLLEAYPKFGQYIKPSIPFLEAVMAVSETVAERSIVNYGLSPDKVFIIGNGYNPDLFKIIKGSQPREALDSLLASHSKTPAWDKLVLYVGKFAGYKALSYFIHAAKRYTELSDYKVITLIVGSGSEVLAHELKTLIEALGLQERVLMVGKVHYHKVGLIMNAADVFILPAVYEPFGLVLLEALACGIRSVASNQAGPTYFVPRELRERKLVILVDPLVVNADFQAAPEEAEQYSRNLADAVLYQLSQPTSEIDRRAISESVQNLTWNACTRQIEKIYYDAIHQHRDMIRIDIS